MFYRSRFVFVVVSLILVAVSTASAQEVPDAITYQGKLTDTAGQPVNGSESLTFTIYDVAGGGTALWSETHSSVSIDQGLFHVLLGSVTPLPDSAFQGNTWLETSLNGTALSPRVRIVSAGYALRAKTADGVADGVITSVQLADNSVTSTKIANGTITLDDLASDGGSLSKVSGGLMSVSGGGINITSGPPGNAFEVYGSPHVKDQACSAGDQTSKAPGKAWQSFRAGLSEGQLVAVELYYGSSLGPWSATLSIYSGEGTSGTELASQMISGSGFDIHKFTLQAPVPLNPESFYTIYVSPAVPCEWAGGGYDPYIQGRSSYDSGWDFWFATYIAGPPSPAIVVEPENLNVSIGSATNFYNFKLFVNGRVGSTEQYTTLSDGRYKRNVQEVLDALTKVKQLRGVTFDWRKDDHPELNFDDRRQIGLIAQEVEKVVPEAVSIGSDDTYSVAYASLVPLLVEAVKEQQKTIEEQQRQIHDIMKLVSELRKER